MKDSKDCEIRGFGLHTCKVRYMLFECFEKLVKKSKISLVDAFVRIFSSFVLFFGVFGYVVLVFQFTPVILFIK